MLSVFKFGRSLSGRFSDQLSLISRHRVSRLSQEEHSIPLVNLRSTANTRQSMSGHTVVSIRPELVTTLSNRPELLMNKSTKSNQRSVSMPKLTKVEAVYSSQPVRDPSNISSKTFSPPECFTIEEKSDKNEGERDSNPGRRKFGVFLTGSALGGIASTFWTYGQLKQQQEQLSGLDGKEDLSRETKKSVLGLGKVLHAAETLNPDQGHHVIDHPVVTTLQKPITGSRRDRFNFIAEVVEETAPALVYIQIKNLGVRDYYTGEAMTTSNGSGFIVKEDGLILTNAHVVLNKPRSSVQVILQDGRSFIGVVEDSDVGSDLATVRIQATDLPIMKLGKSSNIRPGEFVIAMGSPLSLTNTITTGVVSSAARNRSELHIKGRNVSEYIQTDAAITFGNSGGPLLNLDGEAIGINSMKLTPGISFAIPIDHAKEFLQKAAQNKGLEKQKCRRYMGITMVALDDQVIQELRSRQQLSPEVSHGILVFKMVQDSPADIAGIKPGDILTHINRTKILSTNDIYKFLESDCNVVLTVNRQGKSFQLEVDLES